MAVSKQNQRIVRATLFKQMRKNSVPKVTALMAPFLPEEKGNT